MRTVRKLVRNIIVLTIVGKVVSVLVRKRAGPEGAQKILMEVMPKFMDSLLEKLQPERRREILAHWREVLSGLESKHGTSDPTPILHEE